MNIEEILNEIDDMLEEAWSLPFSNGKCVVDAQRVKDYIEDIRLNLPGEIKQAKLIVTDRSDIISSAERQAEATLRKAEERLHIVLGLLIAQDNIDEIVHIIRSSQTPDLAKQAMIERFELSDIQASAIIEMRLRALTGLEYGTLLFCHTLLFVLQLVC